MPPDLAALAPQVPFAQGGGSRPDPSAPLNFANAPGGQPFQASISGGNMTPSPGAPPLGPPQASAQPQQAVQQFNMLLTQDMSPRDHRDAQAGTQTVLQDLMKTAQTGGIDLDGLTQTINSRLPNATPEAKVRVLNNLFPMMSTIAKDQYAKTIQAMEFGLKLEETKQQHADTAAYRETMARIAGQKADQGEDRGGTPFQPTDAEGKPLGPPVSIRGSQATPIRGMPEGAGLTKVGTKPAGGNVSDAQAEWVANYIQTTGNWPVGSGRNQALQNKVEQILATKGVDPQKVAQAAGTFRADQTSLAAATKLADAATSYEKTARKNLDTATNLIHQAAPTNWGPALNKWIETGNTFVGDPTVPASVAAVITLANEYAKVMSGSTGAAAPTEGARAEAAQILNPYFSAGQWDAVTQKVIIPDMNNRIASLYDQVDIIKARIGQPGQSSRPAPEGAVSANFSAMTREQIQQQLQPDNWSKLTPEQQSAIAKRVDELAK